MDLWYVALLGLAVSLVLSATLSVAILPPTRSVLQRLCPTSEAVSFWTRFTVLMMFLAPLIVTLIFGVPYSDQTSRMSATDLVIRVITSALVGSFLTISGIGVRMGMLPHSVPHAPQAVRRTDDEFIK